MAAFHTEAEGIDTLMVLINRCVDALHLMQERMTGIEQQAGRTAESLLRDKSESRADISTLRTRVKLAENNVEQMAIRLSACEGNNIGLTAAGARDLLSARTEAESWRKRAEADLARLSGLESRLVAVETGLKRRLERTESELAATNATATQLRSRAIEGEIAAADLERKLADAAHAIADQRARIACLQAKLTAATDSWRFADQTVINGDLDVFHEGDVMDLAILPEDREISAA